MVVNEGATANGFGFCLVGPHSSPRILSDTHGSVYSPTSPLHEHHFCARCGCTTYGVSPAYTLESEGIPEEKIFAVNARLLDDYALFRALPVEEIDGRNLW